MATNQAPASQRKIHGEPVQVNLYEAKTQLSSLVDRAAKGEEFVIAKAGKPMARLSPISAPPRKKHLGLLKGKIKVADDFNMPLDDAVLGLFEGR